MNKQQLVAVCLQNINNNNYNLTEAEEVQLVELVWPNAKTLSTEQKLELVDHALDYLVDNVEQFV